MKTQVTKVLFDEVVVAKVSVQDVHDKYFSLHIQFPDGTWRRHFISYNSLVPKQDWDSALKRELKSKAR